MSYERLSVEPCGGKITCPSVWVDEADPGHVVIVGKIIQSGTVPTGPGEAAVRLRRETILNAELG